MEKWGLAVITFGLFMMTISSSTNPVNILLLSSGLFYVALGIGMIIYKKKKANKKVR